MTTSTRRRLGIGSVIASMLVAGALAAGCGKGSESAPATPTPTSKPRDLKPVEQDGGFVAQAASSPLRRAAAIASSAIEPPGALFL